jgi:hypothetical protein
VVIKTIKAPAPPGGQPWWPGLEMLTLCLPFVKTEQLPLA